MSILLGENKVGVNSSTIPIVLHMSCIAIEHDLTKAIFKQWL